MIDADDHIQANHYISFHVRCRLCGTMLHVICSVALRIRSLLLSVVAAQVRVTTDLLGGLAFLP